MERGAPFASDTHSSLFLFLLTALLFFLLNAVPLPACFMHSSKEDSKILGASELVRSAACTLACTLANWEEALCASTLPWSSKSQYAITA